jgi:rare lipoprotein A
MPHRSSAFSLNSIFSLGLAAAISIAIYGCSTQAPVEPPPPPAVQPAPPPPVAVTPPKEGPAKVTTASYYGPGLQGHVTSSGEVYDQHAMTAASRTLPIGSKAKVTNLKTGKSVVVRINDHGPYVKGRGIDLSRDAAKHIGIDHDRGVAKVKVTRLNGKSSESAGSSSDVAKKDDATPKTATDSAGVNPPASAANPPVSTANASANSANSPTTDTAAIPDSSAAAAIPDSSAAAGVPGVEPAKAVSPAN